MSKHKGECTRSCKWHIHENKNSNQILLHKNMMYHLVMHESSKLGHTMYNQTDNWVYKKNKTCKTCISKIVHV